MNILQFLDAVLIGLSLLLFVYFLVGWYTDWKRGWLKGHRD